MRCAFRHPSMWVITSGGAVILQLISCAGVWISTGDPFIYEYRCIFDHACTHFQVAQVSTCAGPSGMYLLRKSLFSWHTTDCSIVSNRKFCNRRLGQFRSYTVLFLAILISSYMVTPPPSPHCSLPRTNITLRNVPTLQLLTPFFPDSQLVRIQVGTVVVFNSVLQSAGMGSYCAPCHRSLTSACHIPAPERSSLCVNNPLLLRRPLSVVTSRLPVFCLLQNEGEKEKKRESKKEQRKIGRE